MQDVAFEDDQESVVDCPLVIVVGLAESEAVGAGGGGAVTVTVAERDTLPPAPEQVIEYVVVEEGETVADPDVALPLPKFFVQDVAFEDDQESCDELPLTIEDGVADKEAVGAGLDDELMTAWQPMGGALFTDPCGPLNVPETGPPPNCPPQAPANPDML